LARVSHLEANAQNSGLGGSPKVHTTTSIFQSREMP